MQTKQAMEETNKQIILQETIDANKADKTQIADANRTSHRKRI